MTDFSVSTRDTRAEVFITGVRVDDITTLKDGDEVAVRFVTGETGGSPKRFDYIPRVRVERDGNIIRFVAKTEALWSDYERELYFGSDK